MGQTDQAGKASKDRAWWPYAVVAVIVALACWAGSRSNSREPDAEDLKRDAERTCREDFIPVRLKAPATADFSGVTVVANGATYTVTGQVDSQNSFGAQVRATFSCVVRHSEDQWVLDSAAVDG